MKVRLAFISNSSSASFIIKKSALSLEQINAIRSHIQYTKEKELEVQCADPSNQWNIIEDEEKIGGRTTMANFSMWKFLKAINVRLNDVDYDSDEPIDTGTVDDQLNEIIDRKRKTWIDKLKQTPVKGDYLLTFALNTKERLFTHIEGKCPVCQSNIYVSEDTIQDLGVGDYIVCESCDTCFKVFKKGQKLNQWLLNRVELTENEKKTQKELIKTGSSWFFDDNVFHTHNIPKENM